MEPSLDLDTIWLSRLMKEQHRNDKPIEVVLTKAEPAVPKGENNNSIVSRVKFQVITARGARKTRSLIVKLAKTSEEAKKVLAGFSVFKVETKMFTTVLKQMEFLMDQFDDKRETLWPKWFGGIPYSSMVLEDLGESGYSVVDRRNWQSLDHAMLVLRAMGRYHAMSKVLLSQGLIGEDEKGHYWAGPNDPVKEAMVEGGFHMMVKAMTNQLGAWPAGWEELAKRLDKQKPLMCDKLAELYRNHDKKFEVLCHGDMWSSNIMFKHMEYTGLPTSVKFLDYQVPHLNSFIWDIVYYLYTSVKPSVRRAHKPDLLKAYHQSLADNLKFFEYPGYFPSLDDVIGEDTRMAPTSLFFVVCPMPPMTATVKDAFNLEKMLCGDPEQFLNMEAYTEEKLVREVGDDIKNFALANVI